MSLRKLLSLCEIIVCVSIAASLPSSAQRSLPDASNRFADYFDGPDSKYIGTDRDEAASEALIRSIQTMDRAEVAAGLSIIDRKIDVDPQDPHDYYVKGHALLLLGDISLRPDGPELLASQMGRLAMLLNEPDHRFMPAAFQVLQIVGYRDPAAVIPILEESLTNPTINNKTGPGSGVSVLLLRLAPNDQDAAERVVQYMRRPDMTDDHLLDTIVGIDSSPVIPDAVSTELVRALDRPNDIIKGRALVGISKSSPAAKEAARLRVERMANDPRETAHIRRLAAQVPGGKLAGNPDIDQQEN